MKKYIFLVLLLIIGGGIYYLATNLESIVKKVVHKYGSEVTRTSVDLQGFKLALTDGVGKVQRITVGNPSGYAMPYVFELGEIVVKVNVKSVTTDTIIIDRVEVKKPVVTYEMKSLTQNNISDLQKNVNSYTASKPAEPKKEEAKSSEPSKKVIIKTLVIEQGELNAVSSIMGQTNKLAVKLPPIQMNNIGQNKKGGESVADVISEVISKILTAASQTVVNNNITENLGNIKENVTGAVNNVKDTAGSVVGGVKDTATGVTDSVKEIGNIFK